MVTRTCASADASSQKGPWPLDPQSPGPSIRLRWLMEARPKLDPAFWGPGSWTGRLGFQPALNALASAAHKFVLASAPRSAPHYRIELTSAFECFPFAQLISFPS